MLKIGSVKWRGKCSRHPYYDPASEGLGAIRGNCARCADLLQIYELHQKALNLMRTFQPVPLKSKQDFPDHCLQQNLFEQEFSFGNADSSQHKESM